MKLYKVKFLVNLRSQNFQLYCSVLDIKGESEDEGRLKLHYISSGFEIHC